MLYNQNITDSISLNLTKQYLGKEVDIVINRAVGSTHPKWNFIYECNYGYIKGVLAPDGEELDAYLLKVNTPVETFHGQVIAIIHRLKDDDDKLVVVPTGQTITDEEIEKIVAFQEKWFEHEIIR
ncbi:MAG TPA: inorganic pyrophosphatase [Candidatus Woesebacteria bacterium]|nr:inorganic pyrophosphatase [Candidatus Woesebacteria bacterium]HRT40255.1 inorganic pyrophosphatase [Candidatus Woesebacteria bacterium]